MYQELIRESLARQGVTAEPHLVEAWMTLECGTLDALSRAEFDREVLNAATVCEMDPIASRKLAESYGIAPEAR